MHGIRRRIVRCLADPRRDTALHSWRDVLPTHYQYSFIDALSVPISYHAMAKGCAVSLIYASAFFVFAWRHFARKDILS